MDRVLSRILARIESMSDKVIQFGISFLDDATLGIAQEELVIIGARTGTGKTELLNIIAEGAARHARVAFFSLESHDLEMEQRALFREILQRFDKLPPKQREEIISGGYLDYTAFARGAYNHQALREVVKDLEEFFDAKYENLKVLYRKNPTAKTIENDILSMQGEIDLWILDHLHFLSYEGRDELDAVRQAMKLFYDLAAKQKAPLIIASHLRKDSGGDGFPEISDLHGSSEISKRAVTTVLIDQLSRDKFYAGPNDIPTLFHIAKFRINGMIRRHYAVHQFNTVTRRYSDHYVLMKKDNNGDIVTDDSPKPRWAKHAISKEQILSIKAIP